MPVLLDLERFSIGAREWDLVVAAVYRRVGWYTEAEYGEFIDAYGWDVRDWSGFEMLAAARELRMTAWLRAHRPRTPSANRGAPPHCVPSKSRCAQGVDTGPVKFNLAEVAHRRGTLRTHVP